MCSTYQTSVSSLACVGEIALHPSFIDIFVTFRHPRATDPDIPGSFARLLRMAYHKSTGIILTKLETILFGSIKVDSPESYTRARYNTTE